MPHWYLVEFSTGTDSLASDAVVWAAQHGLVMGSGNHHHPEGGQGTRASPSGVQVHMVHAPVSLTPTPLPKTEFIRAVGLTPVFNRLMDLVSRDRTYLRATLSTAAVEDTFTGELLALLDRVEAILGPGQASMEDPVTLMINRSDYMLDEPTGRLLQVEINMIAASFASLSSLTSKLHRYLASRYTKRDGYEGYEYQEQTDAEGQSNLPANEPHVRMADSMAAAIKQYAHYMGWCGAATTDAKQQQQQEEEEEEPLPILLMVVQPGEKNAFDQQFIASALWERHGIRTERMTLAEVASSSGGCELDYNCSGGSNDGASRSLTVRGRKVGLVYFRAGYAPTDYPTDTEWAGRLKLECSNAPKTPTLPQQLAGAKKVQQALSRRADLERFVTAEEAAQLEQVFAGQWSFEIPDSEESRAVIAKAAAEPAGYVLKPQREGGGNNLYGPAAVNTLLRGGKQLGAFILMERIRPPVNETLFLRQGEWKRGESLSELGIYGALVRTQERGVIVNETLGHLLRTKMASSDEGGVASGFAVLDSPYLV